MRQIIIIQLIISILILPILANAVRKIDDSELRLMYKSFVFSKDLEHAYKIAKKAVILYPKSLFWHKKMGEIALWTNRSNEAMDHITYIYNHTQDKKLADKLIKQLIGTYQYKKALPVVQHEFDLDRIDPKELVNIYDKVGEPQEAIKILKKRYAKDPSPWLLTAILSISLNIGELDGLEDIVKKLESYKDRSIEASLALSNYYFAKKQTQKAYDALIRTRLKATKDDVEYLTKLSDLAWFMHDEDSSVYASMLLYRGGNARGVDLAHLQKYYLNKDPEFSKKISLEALKKQRSDSMLVEYAQNRLEKKDFVNLDSAIRLAYNDINGSKIVTNNPKFWLLKAEADSKMGRAKESQKALSKALELSPNSTQIQSTILWSLIDNMELDSLKQILQKIESESNITDSLYHPLAAGYLAIGQPDRAMRYFKKISSGDEVDLLFLKAEILAAQGEENKKLKIMKQILDILDAKSTKDPSLLKDKKFLRSYLQAYMELTSKDKFKKALSDMKPYLDKKDFRELQILGAMKFKDLKLARALSKNSKDVSPTIQIELAYILHDRAKLDKLIQHYSMAVPNYIKIATLIEDDKIKEAKQLAKKQVSSNVGNREFQTTLEQLYEDYSNHIRVSTGYNKSGDLEGKYIDIQNFYYVAKGYGVITNIKYTNYHSTKQNVLPVSHEDDIDLELGVRKRFRDGYGEASMIYHSSRYDDRVGLRLAGGMNLTTNLYIKGALESGVGVLDQSLYMKLGGNRDTISSQLLYDLDHNRQIYLYGAYNNYFDNHGKRVGDSKIVNIGYNYALPNYKDMSLGIFYQYGDYHETRHIGSLQNLMPRSTSITQKLDRCLPPSKKDKQSKFSTMYAIESREKLLQNDSSDIGITLSYGDDNYQHDNKTHPYFDLTGIYSLREKELYGVASVGVVIGSKDNLSYKIGATYQNSINGLNYSEFDAFIGFEYRY